MQVMKVSPIALQTADEWKNLNLFIPLQTWSSQNELDQFCPTASNNLIVSL